MSRSKSYLLELVLNQTFTLTDLWFPKWKYWDFGFCKLQMSRNYGLNYFNSCQARIFAMLRTFEVFEVHRDMPRRKDLTYAAVSHQRATFAGVILPIFIFSKQRPFLCHWWEFKSTFWKLAQLRHLSECFSWLVFTLSTFESRLVKFDVS